jgi:hypothetical protein
MVCGFHHSGLQLERCDFNVGTWMLNTAKRLLLQWLTINCISARLIVCMDDMVYVFLYALLYLLSCAAGRWQHASVVPLCRVVAAACFGHALSICSACWMRDLLLLTQLHLHVSRLMFRKHMTGLCMLPW